MLKYAALGAIFYQTVLSPYKGFRCAYAATTGCASCSALGYRAIRRHGVIKGVALLRQRFDACSDAYRSIPRPRPMALGQQRGDCDCGGCDMPGDCDGDCGKKCDIASNVADCFSDISDCGSRKRRRRQQRPPQESWWRRLRNKFRRER